MHLEPVALVGAPAPFVRPPLAEPLPSFAAAPVGLQVETWLPPLAAASTRPPASAFARIPGRKNQGYHIR
jgi:hypothetical protein